MIGRGIHCIPGAEQMFWKYQRPAGWIPHPGTEKGEGMNATSGDGTVWYSANMMPQA